MRAMLLAAGRGERMRPLTDTTPKPLLMAGGKPLIEWHIERLVAAGITELIINHAWLGEQIVNTLADGRQYSASISYSAESSPLETAGGIAQALDFFRGEPFLVVNSDIWCDWDPELALSMGKDLLARDKTAWLMLVDNPPQHPQGDFRLEPSGLVCNHSAGAGPMLTFSGIGVYHPKLFHAVPPTQATPLAPLLRSAMVQQQIIGSHYTGEWIDVGTPARLAALEARLTA